MVSFRQLLLCGASFLMVAGAAGAQESVETVTTTGTRIIADGYQTPTPVTTITITDLSRNNPQSIPEGLQALPQFVATTGPQQSHASAGTPQAGNYLNLRGLGAIENLTMVDGARLPATSFDGTVDANIIPQAFVSRVDVVTGGASASYGSDAVSGVINFIIDKHFNGVKGSLEGGISTFRDRPVGKFSLAGGMPVLGGKGHIEGSFDHLQEPILECSPRYITDCNRPRAWGYGLTGTGLAASPRVLSYPIFFNNASYGTVITSASNSANAKVNSFAYNNYTFAVGGQPVKFNAGTPTGSSNYNVGGDGALTYGTSLASGVISDQGYARFDYDFSSDLQVYASVMGSQIRDTYVTVADGSQVNAFQIFQDNAFLPTAISDAMKAQKVAYFVGSRFEADQPPKLDTTISTAIVAQIGARGTLWGWNWQLDYNHGDSHLTTNHEGNFNYNNWYPALDAVKDPSTGNIVCRTTLTNPGLKPGCVPWNPFGEGSPSKAAYDYINGTMKFAVKNIQDDISGQISGALFDLPAGTVRMATGFEYRAQSLNQTSNNDPSKFVDQTGFCHRVDANGAPTGVPVTSADCNAFTLPAGVVRSTVSPSVLTFSSTNVGPSKGSQDVAEGFAEFAVPILKDMPLIEAFSANIAYRFAQYSSSGSANTWKLGLDYQPLDDLRVRATMSRDFRAPTLYELFAGQSASFAQFDDAIHSGQRLFLITLSGGNPNLKPEVGNTSTVGMVWTPSYLEGFTASLDYYTVRITNQISKISSTTENQLCESSGGTDPLCAFIVRPTPFSDHTAASFPFNITTVPYNQASVSLTGFDLDMSYRFDMNRIFDNLDSSMNFRFIGTYTPSVLTFTGIGGRVLQGAGAGNIPKIKFNVDMNYIDGPLNLGARVRFIGPVYFTHDPTVFYSYNGGLASHEVAYLDLNASYGFNIDGVKFETYGRIANVFNRFVFVPGTGEPNEFYPTNQSLYDLIGRYFSVGVRFQL